MLETADVLTLVKQGRDLEDVLASAEARITPPASFCITSRDKIR